MGRGAQSLQSGCHASRSETEQRKQELQGRSIPMVAWEHARKKLMKMGYAEALAWAAYRLVRPFAPCALSRP